MKLRSVTLLMALFIVATSVAMSWPKMGWPKSKNTINLAEPAIVGSVTLQPGEYNIDWSGAGPDVQVSFSREGKTIATAPATLESAQKQQNSVVTSEPQGSGLRSIREINLKNSTLHFAQSDTRGGD